MRIRFSGGKRVEAEHRGFVIQTDQRELAGGENSAPEPFELFLASIGTCSGLYVLAFCERRGIPTDGIEMSLETVRVEERHMLARIEIEVRLPESFPEKYVEACLRAARQCAVSRHLDDPPEISLTARRSESKT